jgi:hypothetical protein
MPLELALRGPLAKRIGTFVVVVILGFVLWPLLSDAYTSSFQASANALLGGMRFGKGGHALFLPASNQQAASTGRDASWEAPVELSIEGVEKKHVVSVNPRRLAYLPWFCFAALVAATPLRASAKAKCLLVGSALLGLIALVSVWVIIAWIFARVPGLVYDLESWERTLLDLSYEAFVTPMGNKFVLPLILAVGLVLWQMAREKQQRGSNTVKSEDGIVATSKRTRARRSRRRRANASS